MVKSKQKIMATFLLVLVILTNVLPVGVSFAANQGDSVGITSVGRVPYHLKSHALPSGGYVKTSLAGYYENGNFYPAYCLNKNLAGVDESLEYSVTLTEILSNQETYNKVWRTVVAGYPYNSPESLGVSSWEYAYQATKMAVYCALGQCNPSDFYANDEIGQSIVNLIQRLANEGENGSTTYRTPVANINKSGNMILNGEYYIQNYTISSNVDISSYDVAMANFPNGTKITNISGNEQNTFNNGEVFQLKIPKDIVETQDINGKLRVDVDSKSYAVFYSTSYNPSLQDYAITGDPIALTSARTDVELKANTASIKIKKIDTDTKQPIKDTIYELSKADGTVIGRATTDSTGNLTFYDLYQNDYVLKEIKSNDDYVISQEKINIKAKYNKVTELTLENKHKTGNLKVYKVDKENHKISLGNVEFDLYSEEFKKVIGTYRTNVDGEIKVENLRTGNYKWIEKTTNKYYNLGEDREVKVEWEKTNESLIENELKKGQIRVIKIDLDNNEVKLKGVKFNVLDEKNNVLETIITNDEGEAITSKYPVRDFEKLTLQEVETKENYKLNNEKQTITLEANQIKDITFKNEKKKGQIKVIKVDQDNNEVKLKGVEFKVYDEDKNLVDTLITDENGEATSKRLRIDKKYIVQESKTLENYVLNETPQTVTLTQDQITDLTFENELIKGYIRVIKVSKEDNQYNGDVKGKRLENAKFEVYDENNNLVDTLVTDENGEATTKELLKGKYTLKEVESPDYYILTDEIFEAEIVKHQEIVDVEVENDNVDIDIEVNKEGFKETQSKDSIYYDFSNIHNKSNIALDNFTWSDSLPTNALRANKIYTGTWNEDLTYSVWYKTNLSDDYIMLKDGLSTLVNNEVKFTDATLQEGEFITDFEFRFGTVKADFREVEQPRLYCDMLDNLPNGFIFVNHTKVSGNYKDIYVEDKDDWTTITYYKEIETTQKLPRTGC